VSGNDSHFLYVPVSESIPSGLRTGWQSCLFSEGEVLLHLHSGYCFQDVHARLDLGVRELSGALGPTWISVRNGTTFFAPCEKGHLFSWHYHPDGDSRLSVEDWISFIISDAQVTLLLTVNQACLYSKLHEGRWKEIRSDMTGTTHSPNDKPNLRFLRFMKLMQKELQTREWPLCAEDEIASALGIDYKSELIK
jgi:hypothetical protein